MVSTVIKTRMNIRRLAISALIPISILGLQACAARGINTPQSSTYNNAPTNDPTVSPPPVGTPMGSNGYNPTSPVDSTISSSGLPPINSSANGVMANGQYSPNLAAKQQNQPVATHAYGGSISTPSKPQTPFIANNNIVNTAPKKKIQAVRHTVQAGDTVYSLGRKYNSNPKEIIALNKLQAPYSLAINQQVLVPVNGIQQANVQQVTPAATPTQKPQQQIPAKPTTSPVVQAAKPAKATLHAVQAGDTVYSLGRKYNMKPADIITMNNLQAPYALAIGQQVKLNPNAKAITAVASNTTITATPAKTANKNFQIGMPAQGPISVKYGKQPDGTTSSGIRIAVKDGASVQTVEDGQVIYVGNIKGYGQMVLVRHEDGWITNYARLKQTLVSQGDRVYKGKAIAIAGQTLDFNKSELFFEVRKGTATQDPLAHFVNS